ncbi:MAG: ABC transporter ATP-binding protein [Planctomycetes bacterium]|nr:ABC transporter ATP-binding protein [Planctomycetota bacterium]
MTPILETRELTKLYGVVIGVNDMTFDIRPGVHGLLGPNGAGKSTLLKLMTAQLRPSVGSIRVLGEDPWSNPELFRRIGFCPEYDAFYDFMTAFEFVESLGRLSGMSRSGAKQAAERALESCNATEFMHRPIRTYSKGMRQRTKVAQALVHDPELLILDEPLTGTDPIGRHELTELIKRLGAEGRSIVVSSHVLHEVQEMTHEFLLIFGGRILASGNVHEIRSLMNEFPHRINVRCGPGQAHLLASRLASDAAVTDLELADDGTIVVGTRDPAGFYARFAEHALHAKVTVHELSSEDDNLEAVFRYLTGAR